MIILYISMSCSATMAGLGKPRARSVEIATNSTSARNVLAAVFAVKHVSLNSIRLIHCIGLRCVLIIRVSKH